jgi:hypothetical protein
MNSGCAGRLFGNAWAAELPCPDTGSSCDICIYLWGPLIEKLDDLLVGSGSDCGIFRTEAVAAIGDGDEFMAHVVSSQLFGHERGLLVRDVGVLGTVNEQSRGILRRDVAERTKGIENCSFGLRIMAGEDVRPETLLPAVKIKSRRKAAALSRLPTCRHPAHLR